MRAKEFIEGYAITPKPTLAVTGPCPTCKGEGNVSDENGTHTCPTCSGAGSAAEIPADSVTPQQYPGDLDHQMNMPNTLWAAGKF